MNTSDLTFGKVYLLRGGHILRYQGLYAGKGPCLAFRGVLDGVSEPPVGYSASIDEVLQEVTLNDAHWLKERREASLSRGLDEAGEDLKFILKELGAT